MNIDNSIIGGEMVDRGIESRRYMFVAELNGTIGTQSEKEKDGEKSNTFTWDPEVACEKYSTNPVENGDLESLRQTLIVRRLILGPAAKVGEAHWVNVEVTDPMGSDTSFPLAYLSKGSETQTMVDIAFPDLNNVKVKFTLTEGTGPVHIVGYHLVERPQPEMQEECEEEYEDEEIGEEKEEEAKAELPTLRAKRRINGENGEIAAKKMKTNGNAEAMEEATDATAK